MHRSISKRWAGLDYKVWICFIISLLLSAGLLAYKIFTYVPCQDFSIITSSNIKHPEAQNTQTFYVNEQITFTVSIRDTKQSVTWDFDDQSTSQKGATVTHTYLKEGYYLIKAILNGKCIQSLNIRIIQSNTSTLNTIPAVNPIISADIVTVGDEVVFNSTAAGANYEWSIEELPTEPKQITSQAKFLFTKPGNYTVALKIDDKVYRKIIQVDDILSTIGTGAALPPVSKADLPPVPQEPLPPLVEDLPKETPKEMPVVKQEPEPPAKTYDQLPEPAIKAMIQGVIDGKKDIEDFNNILCNGAGTKVVANDEATTFAAFCNELKEKKGVLMLKKKRKIESFKVVRDETSGNCVKIIYINYK